MQLTDYNLTRDATANVLIELNTRAVVARYFCPILFGRRIIFVC